MKVAPTIRLGVVVSQFNPEVTGGLLAGARQYLAEQGLELADGDIFSAPGAYEIPIIARAVAVSRSLDGVICLGCVIKGDTAHFEFISLAATMGLMTASLDINKPLSFGILTTYTDEQAEARSADDAHNKGREAAAACLQTVQSLRALAPNAS
jgi:6,7-dimethyl-8-ribityllumazine synthase